MTTLNDDTVSTLRRRARELLADGYNAQYVKVLERAAENLEVHKRYLVSGEAFTLGAIMANRVLRNALNVARGILREVRGRHEPMLTKIDAVLKGTKEPGLGRHILMLEVVPGKDREALEAEVAVVLDAYFKKGETDNGATITPAVTVTGDDRGDRGGVRGTESRDDAGDARAPSRARGARQ